jgi:hypothetical protein
MEGFLLFGGRAASMSGYGRGNRDCKPWAERLQALQRNVAAAGGFFAGSIRIGQTRRFFSHMPY